MTRRYLFLPYLGGPHHLQPAEFSIHTTKQVDGYTYTLIEIPELRGKFYLYYSLQPGSLDKTLIDSYLHSLGRFSPEMVKRYSRWYTRYTIARLGYSWIYVRPKPFFAELPTDITTSKFRKQLSEYMFKSRRRQIIQTLHLLQNSFPKSLVGRRQGCYPLVLTAFHDLYRLLAPDTAEKAELLALTLSYYCHSPRYLYALAEGKKRIDLQGNPHEYPDPRQRLRAYLLLSARHPDTRWSQTIIDSMERIRSSQKIGVNNRY